MRLRAFIVLSLLVTDSVAHAQIPREDFRWRVPLQENLTSGTLYKVLIPGPLFAGSHSFPSDLRFLDENGEDWPFFIQQPIQPEPLTAFPLIRVGEPSDYEARQGIQTIFLDAQYERHPLRYLALEIQNEQFTRPVKVFGRNTPVGQWRWMADGAIHRIEGLERNRIDLHNNGFRYLRLDVYNYEEPELVITNAFALAEPQFLITRAKSDGRAWIYFGSDTFLLPRFDLQHSLSRSELTNATLISTAARERNPDRLVQEFWLYARLLLYVVLDFAAIFVALTLIKKFRNR